MTNTSPEDRYPWSIGPGANVGAICHRKDDGTPKRSNARCRAAVWRDEVGADWGFQRAWRSVNWYRFARGRDGDRETSAYEPKGWAMKRTTFTLLLALLLILPTAASASANSSSSSAVLPATAQPYGISLTAMAQNAAVFESKLIANETPKPQPPPSPFQFLSSLSSSYVVNSHTLLYVPVFSFDDSPAVTGCPLPGIPGTPGCVGVFPANHNAALSYVFGAQKMGGHDMAITIDGAKTPLSQDYLAGPVSVSPKLDDGAANGLVIAAYVAPLAPGTHTVTISGVFDGPYIEITLGLSSLPFVQQYTVNVTP